MNGVDNGFNDRNDENAGGETSLALSPDGRCFATAESHCDIALWDTQTGTHITTLEYSGGITSLEFLPDGQLYLETPTGRYRCGILSLAHVSKLSRRTVT